MNNYYEEIYLKVKKLIDDKDYLRAEMMIEDELNMPYVPNEFEIKMLELESEIKDKIKKHDFRLNDDELEKYLKSDPYKQIVAVNYLDTLNLREYIDLAQNFLLSNGSNEAKCLLISSLINQDINNEIRMIKDDFEISFIPRYVESIEITDGFIEGDSFLKNIFENDNPSLYAMAKDLLIKECFLYLPFSYEEDEGLIIAKRIVIYLYECLNDMQSKEAFIKKYINENEMLLINQKKI